MFYVFFGVEVSLYDVDGEIVVKVCCVVWMLEVVVVYY